MNAEIGLFALILALMLACVQSAYWLPRVRSVIAPILPTAAMLQALMVTLALLTLAVLRLDNDFSVQNVAMHSNRALPLLYKIAGTWGNHEGSMLLFSWVLSLFGAALATSRSPERKLMFEAASIQALLAVGILLFIILTSNPFARLFPAPLDGEMLNPLLQDMALSIHPPMLYLGYVGFSAVFSLAVAGLLQGNINKLWAHAAHPWMMMAWGALTLGIGLGSWWAYRELGWGGFWFWDPVENASLLPWLAGTALLHSNVVLKKRGALASWVALLSILTFGLSLLGTFLVRSGVITSVHSFASDPARGIFILLYMAITIGGALFIYALRAHTLPRAALIRPSSREGMIVVNNLFILTACATVLLGTLYPIIMDAIFSQSLTVGAPYFNATFLPLMAIPLLFAGITPFMPWKKARFKVTLMRAWPALLAALCAIIFILAVVSTQTLLAAAGLGLGAFLLAASGQWLLAGKWRNAANWPVFLGHFGAALLIIGITGTGLWSKESERFIRPGETLSMAGYVVTYVSDEAVKTDNYHAKRATLTLEKNKQIITTLSPEYRRYNLRETNTSETAIYSTAAYDIYSVIGETSADGRTAIRLYFRPTISFLWLGCIVVTCGGLLAAVMGSRRKA